MDPGTLVTTTKDLKLSYPESRTKDLDPSSWGYTRGREDIPFEKFTIGIILESYPSVLGANRFWLKIATSKGCIGMCFSDEIIKIS